MHSHASWNRTRHSDSLREAWIDTGIALLCILPLLLTAHLPLSDLPNHLARQYILRDWATSPSLQMFYLIHWRLVPNLALELFVLGARVFMPLDAAVRAFCIATVLLLFFGTRLVNRTLSGNTSRAYRLTPLLCYGGPFQSGFLSYCFGVGLSLLLFGAYLRMRTRSAPVLGAVVALSGFVVLLCHMAAFGLFTLAVGGCEVAHAATISGADRHRLAAETVRRLALPMGCLASVLAAFVGLGPSGSHNAAVNAASSIIHFDLVKGKARSVFAIIGFSSRLLEGGLLVLALAGFASAFLGKVIRSTPVGTTVFAAMLTAWLLLPDVAGGSALIDYRIPWAVSFFVLASIVPASQYARFSLALSLYTGVLAVARIALISGFWLTWEPSLSEIDRALSGVPVGTRLFVIKGDFSKDEPFRAPDLDHVASYVVARRQGFEPGIFAGFPGQILDFQPRYEQLWTDANFVSELPSALDHVQPEYDYVLVLLPTYARLSAGLPLHCEASGNVFDLYKVDHPPAGNEIALARCAH